MGANDDVHDFNHPLLYEHIHIYKDSEGSGHWMGNCGERVLQEVDELENTSNRKKIFSFVSFWLTNESACTQKCVVAIITVCVFGHVTVCSPLQGHCHLHVQHGPQPLPSGHPDLFAGD